MGASIRGFNNVLVTAAYAAKPWDNCQVDLATAAADVTITLPATTVAPPGPIRIIVVDDDQTNGYKCLVNRNSSNIRGLTETNSLALVCEGEKMVYMWEGRGCGWSVDDGRIIHTAKLIANAQQVDIDQTPAAFVTLTLAAAEYTAVGCKADTSASAITVRRDGKYRVSSVWSMASIPDQISIICEIRKNAAALHRLVPRIRQSGASALALGLAGGDEFSLAAGDVITTTIWSDIGDDTMDTAYTAGIDYCSLVVTEVR